jgi:hypothetical protein
MELSRRRLWIVHFLVLIALLGGCGREGGTAVLPDKKTFCELAIRLSNDATGKLAPLGANPSLAELARRLSAFIAEHRADYERLDSIAPAAVRPALRRQRAGQQAFVAATTDAGRRVAYNVTVRNGRKITDYERENCF